MIDIWRDFNKIEKNIVFIGIFLFLATGGLFIHEKIRGPKITSGIVIAKEHLPAKLTTTTMLINSGSSFIPVARNTRRPERWKIIIQENGIQETFFVQKQVFDSIKIGERHTFDKKFDSRIEPEE